MRLFVAINFNDETRSELVKIQRRVKSSAARGRFPDPVNFHLTLAFLGECDTKQLHAAESVLSSMIFAPFELTFERVGRFRRRGGDLWWAGIRLTPELEKIHAELSKGLTSVGFSLDLRPFRPHVTLARQVVDSIVLPNPPIFNETIRSIELMESIRVNGRLKYKPLFSVASH